MLFHTGVVTQGFLHWSSCIGVFTQEFLHSFFTGDLSQEFLHRSFCTGVFAQEFLHRSSYTGVLTQEFLHRSFTQGFFHASSYTGIVTQELTGDLLVSDLLHNSYFSGSSKFSLKAAGAVRSCPSKRDLLRRSCVSALCGDLACGTDKRVVKRILEGLATSCVVKHERTVKCQFCGRRHRHFERNEGRLSKTGVKIALSKLQTQPFCTNLMSTM